MIFVTCCGSDVTGGGGGADGTRAERTAWMVLPKSADTLSDCSVRSDLEQSVIIGDQLFDCVALTRL